MRVIAGAWRGRSLKAPLGRSTRPTADRTRQALFDMLMHAHWGGPAAVQNAVVLDLFAGTGALGIEALSRGAARAVFVEKDRAAVNTLRANITACGADTRCRVVMGDVLTLRDLEPAGLVFLDPPYGFNLVPRAIAHLRAIDALAPSALIVAEIGADEAWDFADTLADRTHGAARLLVWRDQAPHPLGVSRMRQRCE